MHSHPPQLKSAGRNAGYTLIEVTTVITVILGLVMVLYVQFAAYKRGADRAACIQKIATVQRAVRSYGNLFEYFPGDTVPGLKDEFIGLGKFVEEDPACPDDGTYTFLGDLMPAPGALYIDCSIADHVPDVHDGW
jgi:prepilin-type N-terminal cleavage/methylation domain-containing protein